MDSIANVLKNHPILGKEVKKERGGVNSERSEMVEKLVGFMGEDPKDQKRFGYWLGRTRHIHPSEIHRLMRSASEGRNPAALFNHLLKSYGKKKKLNTFVPHKCGSCEQTTNYALPLDKGSAMILIAIYNAVKRLGRNRVHLTKEMEVRADSFESYRAMIQSGHMTSIMQGNASRPRFHGLIAYTEHGSGEYLITRKGAAFLRGEPIQRVAIIDKASSSNIGYHLDGGTVTIGELLEEETFWLKEVDITHITELESEQETLGLA